MELQTYAKLTEYVIVRFRWVWIPAHRALDNAEPKAPDIALHAVSSATWICASLRDPSACNSFGRHVALTTDVGLRNTCHQVATDAEVADFDLAPAVH